MQNNMIFSLITSPISYQTE